MRWKQPNSDSLRPIILLLAVAVILPTVCLLWFMTQAVKNERLAVRQKLIDQYTAKADAFITLITASSKDYAQSVAIAAQSVNEHSVLTDLLDKSAPCIGLLLFNEKNERLYPTVDMPPLEQISDAEPFKVAWRLEFTDKQYDKAVEEYKRITDSNLPPAVGLLSRQGLARCLDKAGQPEDAKKLYTILLQAAQEINPVIAAHARLRLAELYNQTSDSDLAAYCADILRNNFSDLNIPTAMRVFLVEKVLALTVKTGLEEPLAPAIEKTQRLLAFESLSLAIAEELPDILSPDQFSADGVYPVDKDLYGCVARLHNITAIGLMEHTTIAEALTPAAKELDDNLVFYRILDPTGTIVAGQQKMYRRGEVSFGQQFLSRPLPVSFPGWKLEMFFRYGVFEAAADRQAAIYKWTGVLVVVLMLLAGIVAIRAVGRQIRLNALKNNFIATVTHELKTPLSSMRLLVETLLDGGHTDQPRCREYLEMIGRENRRLSRMIDSFLTFSRMERGKQVFEMQRVSPVEVAEAAAEAVQAKFHEKKCRFSVTADTPLPSIMADTDAMVTVLVNLLDNACKYSGDNKEITLRVFKADDGVCFSVADNGLGMTRRQSRRIFDKFYQADTSLTRRAEGCGLGLSIVKYILDAHKATITVDSKPGKGSVFTVKIPF